MSSLDTLNAIASAHDTHSDFDGVLARFTGGLIFPHIRGLRVLECGCSTGVMTPGLLECSARLEVVEGSSLYADIVKKRFPELPVHVSFFEDFTPEKPFDCLVVAGVLHHLTDPEGVLKNMREWVVPGGFLLASVPNMTSFHRQLGVAMGLTKQPEETSERNKYFHQPGRFTQEKFTACAESAGWRVQECSGFFFKPFPHEIMNSREWPEPLLEGLFQMGRKYPELSCQLFLRATRV